MLFLICLILSRNLYSTYFKNSPVELTQPDGTNIIAYVTGFQSGGYYDKDFYCEFRYHDKGDYTIIKDESTGEYCWAKQNSDGWLISTGFAIHKHNPKSLGLLPSADDSSERKQERALEERKKRNNLPNSN